MIPHSICMGIISLKNEVQLALKNEVQLVLITRNRAILLHSSISGANCFILQIPMLSLGLFTWDVYIITRGEAEGNNVNVEGKESQG